MMPHIFLEETVPEKLHRFLSVSGCVLLLVAAVRFYRVVRGHAEDPRFAPHLMVAMLSLWIASSILRVGLKKKELNRKGAISLIRCGSVLLAIWSYRFFLFLRQSGTSALPFQAFLAPFYMVFGTVIMCSGLKVSRTLRREAKNKHNGSLLSAAPGQKVRKKSASLN